MDAGSIMMDAAGTTSSSSAMPSAADACYYFGDDINDFNDFERHMFGDEDDLPTSRGRSTDLRSHLEDLANRHPEFADHLRSPPGWVSDLRAGGVGGASGKWAGPSGSSSGSRERFFEPGAEGGHNSQPSEEGAGLSQHGLRNTVPDINSQTASNEAARSQRSMSAPPDHNRQAAADKPQRFVSKIEINPVNPATGQTAADAADCSKPPPAPPSTKPNMQQPPQHKTSTVRHIPIFVEGRDEPILPKNVDQEYQAPPPPPTQPQFTSSHQFQPQNQEQHRKPSFQGYQHHHQQQSPPPPPPPSTQQQQPSPPSRPRDQPDAAPVAPEQPKVDVNDPIYKVQLIQKEVDALKQKIEGFECQTRADKEYIYLDEMLTRNLLKLDNISTEGKEKVRAVRKEAINSVQKCISLLESKVKEQQSMDVDKGQNDAAVAVEKDVQEEKSVDQGGEEQPAAAQENGPVEKVPKTDAQPAAEANNDNNPNEIKC